MHMLPFARPAAPTSDVARVIEKVQEFGQVDDNPVRDEIAELRKEREAGRLSDSDWACRVAELLGAVDAGG